MTRRLLTLFTGMLILTAGILIAADEKQAADNDDPPIRLKKKKKADGVEPAKKAEARPPLEGGEKKPDGKKDEKKPDDMPGEVTRDGEPVTPDEEEKEVFERIAKNMKASEERLANKELNDGTRQIQEDIVKDLDSLIKSAENGGGEGGDDQDPMAGQDDQKQKGQSKAGQSMKSKSGNKMGRGQRKSGRKQGGNQLARGQQKSEGQEGDKQGAEKGGQDGKNGGGNGTNKQNRFGDLNRDADVYKDVWGHLPEVLRAQMDAYSTREKYMDKHHDLIKQYYKTIAAQGRKKGE